ncbi:MAG: glycosyltransferase family 4 protein [Candidatus Roizmanbacteria bacterium]|nr:glycosyltransferase family 4 protein [Candidatus Roizmanbacteria bacterium]
MHQIAYLCHLYPSITQTFVFNEIQELKSNKVALQTIAFKQPDKKSFKVLMPAMQAEVRCTIYMPASWSLTSLRSQLEVLVHFPWRYFTILWQTLRGPYMGFSSLKLRIHACQDFVRGVDLGMFLKRNGFYHIHAEFPNHSATSAWVAHKITGIPFSFRSYTSYNSQIIKKKIKDAKFVLCCSEYDKNRLLSYSSKHYSDKLIIDVLGIDVDNWQPCESIKEVKGLILCVASLGDKKGQEYLIRACQILKIKGVQFKALIVGDGPDKEMLTILIEKLKLREHVRMQGFCTHSEVKYLMQESTVFCLPCIKTKLGDTDGIPFVLMEAMALGKTCVSTTVSGIPELIEHRINGLLVKERDPASLASALLEALDNKDLRCRIGKAARKSILSKFDIHKNVAITSKFFIQPQKQYKKL